MQIRNFLKQIIPPVAIVLLAKIRQKKANPIWSGNYLSWSKAQKICDGYDSEIILEKCKASLLKVKRGEAKYERDSVLFDKIQLSFPVLAALQIAAIENANNLCVLDFGGSLGSSYFQNKEFLSSTASLRWCIVEQPKFVDCGKANFEDNNLHFYNSVAECQKRHTPNVILLSGVLQYLEFPHAQITGLVDLNFPYIIIDRTSFIEADSDIISVQRVPENIYDGSYPCWFFNEENFLSHFSNYQLMYDFKSYADSDQLLDNKKVSWRGFFFKRKKH